MLREKRVVNNNRYGTGNWHPDSIMGTLERDGIRLADKKFRKATEYFRKVSYYQTEEGRLAGGMKRKCDMED